LYNPAWRGFLIDKAKWLDKVPVKKNKGGAYKIAMHRHCMMRLTTPFIYTSYTCNDLFFQNKLDAFPPGE